jgi:DNA-binding phage protein
METSVKAKILSETDVAHLAEAHGLTVSPANLAAIAETMSMLRQGVLNKIGSISPDQSPSPPINPLWRER